MAIKEKKVTANVTVCDMCGKDIEAQATFIEGSASGYMKRDNLRIDLCESCAAQIGLKRRGRRPATMQAPEATPKEEGRRPRGRPRKNPAPQAASDDDWEG